MTTRTWVGPQGHRLVYSWADPQNWSPVGTPQAGDNLTMVTGQMDITYSKLPAELHLGNGQYNAGPVTLDMVSASATVDAVGGQLSFLDPLTINAYGDATHPSALFDGKDYLTADNLQVIDGTVNIFGNQFARSDLVVTGRMEFAYTGEINGPGILTNNGTISMATGSISADVNGHGTLELHNYHDGTGAQTISGAIGGGQNVVLVAHNHDTRTELVHPETFKARLEVAETFNGAALGSNAKSDFLEIDGIHASRMDTRGDMLRLYGAGNRPLWQVREHMPAGYTASMTNTATGTEIAFVPHQLIG